MPTGGKGIHREGSTDHAKPVRLVDQISEVGSGMPDWRSGWRVIRSSIRELGRALVSPIEYDRDPPAVGAALTPVDMNLPAQRWADDAVAAIVRIAGGNFRLLNWLLPQMERILEIDSLRQVTKAVVEAARESLVIGQP